MAYIQLFDNGGIIFQYLCVCALEHFGLFDEIYRLCQYEKYVVAAVRKCLFNGNRVGNPTVEVVGAVYAYGLANTGYRARAFNGS